MVDSELLVEPLTVIKALVSTATELLVYANAYLT